jgi:hypothetical protein
MLAILPYLGDDRLPCSGYSIARGYAVPDPAEHRVRDIQHVVGLQCVPALMGYRVAAELDLETGIDEGAEVLGELPAFAACGVVLAVAGHVV